MKIKSELNKTRNGDSMRLLRLTKLLRNHEALLIDETNTQALSPN